MGFISWKKMALFFILLAYLSRPSSKCHRGQYGCFSGA